MDAPPIVDQNVEDAQKEDQERRAPLRLEADDDHDASAEAKERNEDTRERPGALEDEADEEEDEQNSTGELEADGKKMNSKELAKSKRELGSEERYG